MHFLPLDQPLVDAVRAGGPDAYGHPAEYSVAGGGVPCRSCLCHVPVGQDYLILAACPFPELQPYAETGPIFLCAAHCTLWQGNEVPPVLRSSREYLVKGYTAGHRILYGTGAIVESDALSREVSSRLENSEVAVVDVRSASNNCFLSRAVRGGAETVR